MSLASLPTVPGPAVGLGRVPTARLPRLRGLCGADTPGGPCHLAARHPDGHLPPPPRIVRPHQWAVTR